MSGEGRAHPTSPDAPLPRRIGHALADEPQKAALAHATGSVNANRRRAMAGFEGYEAARATARAIKERAIAELPRWIEALEEAVRGRGGIVHRAADGAEARGIIVGIALEHGIRRAVKMKSMTSEEIHLNGALEEAGIAVRETDLGEYIIQLSGDRPSHIIAPIIHKSVEDVRAAFRDGLDLEEVPAAAPELTQLARRQLRREFLEAEMGITGANFLLADTGTVVLVENEGNGRMTTQIPPVHVVLAGVEKILPSAADLLPFLQLLPRSGTGQLMTSYLSFISGPGWSDSPTTGGAERELHVVLLDNGRMEMRDDPTLREALYCIRCGACMTVCPPYQVVGGHVYGGPTYHSGIGNAWEAGVRDLDTAASFNALCTTCSRCQDVCPVHIDIPWMNTVLRERIASDSARGGLLSRLVAPLLPIREDHAVDLATRLFSNPARLYRLLRSGGALARGVAGSGVVRQLLSRVAGLDPRRSLPMPEPVRVADWQRDRGGIVVGSAAEARRIAGAGPPGDLAGGEEARGHRERHREATAGATVALFVDCHTDNVDTPVGRAAVAVLEKLGFGVVLVAGPCCGRGALSQGALKTGAHQAGKLQEALRPLVEAGHPVVGIEPSCLSALVDDHPKLDGDGSALATSAAAVEILEFIGAALADARIPEPAWKEGAGRTVLHGHCQQKTMGWLRPAIDALERIPGLELQTTTAECCGMAGSFGYKERFAGISVELGDRLLAEIEELEEAEEGAGGDAPRGGRCDLLACGTSCRAQIADLGGRRARHPVELLAELLA